MLTIPVCSLAMRLKGMDSPIGGLYKALSSVAVGLITWNQWIGVAWLLGIMPGLPELGKLTSFDRKAWEQGVIRGAWNGVCLTIATGWVWPVYAGVTMPLWYFLGFNLMERWPQIFKKGTHTSGWAVGEFLFGAVLGAALWLSV